MRNFFKKISVEQGMILAFLAVILIGSFLLSLPCASDSGEWTRYGDALFTSVSATCVTGLVNGKDCVFTCYQDLKDLGDGHTIPNCCLCTLERAYREGKSKFKKPISCALYPIRAKDFGNDVYGINYNKWRICKDAIKKGEELNMPVYKFLKGPLIEKFGQAWYDELCEIAEQLLADLEK